LVIKLTAPQFFTLLHFNIKDTYSTYLSSLMVQQ